MQFPLHLSVFLAFVHHASCLELGDGLGFFPADAGVEEHAVEIHNTADDGEPETESPEGSELDPTTPDPEIAEMNAILDKMGLFEMEPLPDYDEGNEEVAHDETKKNEGDKGRPRYVTEGLTAANLFNAIISQTRANLMAVGLYQKTLANQRAIIPMQVSDGSRRDLNMDLTRGQIFNLHDAAGAATPPAVLYRADNRMTAAVAYSDIRSQANFRLRVGANRAVPGQDARGFVQARTTGLQVGLEFGMCDDGTPNSLRTYTLQSGTTELTYTRGIPNNWSRIDKAGLVAALNQHVEAAVNVDVKAQLERAIVGMCTCC